MMYKRYYPNERLIQSLKLKAGMRGEGYISFANSLMPEDARTSRSFMSRVFSRDKAAPVRMMVWLIRFAALNDNLTDEEAWALRDDWFDGEEEVNG